MSVHGPPGTKDGYIVAQYLIINPLKTHGFCNLIVWFSSVNSVGTIFSQWQKVGHAWHRDKGCPSWVPTRPPGISWSFGTLSMASQH